MQSRLLWSHITLQDCSVMPKKRNWHEVDLHIQKPKKVEFTTAAFLGYLKKNHRDTVVELDLTNAGLESEGDYLPRKFNVQYAPEYNDDHMNVFWNLMFDFPNLRNLSIYGTFFAGGSQVSFSPPVNKNLRSSVRNLNTLKQNLFYHTRESIKTILDFAPELEVLQIQDVTEDLVSLDREYPKLKQLLFVLCSISPGNIFEKCPNLEIFINHKYNNNWGGEEEETVKAPVGRDNLIVFTGERKPLRDIPVEKIIENAKAMVNVRYSTSVGLPLLHDLVNYDSDERLELCLKTLKMDPNIKLRTTPDVTLDPFVLLYPYDSASDDRGWGDVTDVSIPPLLENGDSPLHYAVKRKKPKLVKMLLENGANPNVLNSAHRTPIHYATNFALLNVLMEHGAIVDVVDKDGWNSLMNFIANKSRLYPLPIEEIEGHISFNDSYEAADATARQKMVEHLIELACDINYQAPNGLNALKVALSVNDGPIIEYLLKYMKNPLVETSPCISLLSCVAAATPADTKMIEKLLELGADPTVVDERGQTYLHVATERQQFHLLGTIEHVKDPAKLLALTDSAGFTCLHYAVLPSTPDVIWECDIQQDYIKYLIKKLKQNMNVNDSVQRLELFLTLGADSAINVQATSGETPLLLVCRSMPSSQKENIVKRLLKHGANPNIVDYDGGSPLIAAAYALDYEVVNELLEAGADVSHCDNKSVNALFAATMAIAKRFLEVRNHNYSQGYRDHQKMQIKDTDRNGFNKIFKLLLEKKIPVNQQDKLCGLSVLHILANITDDSVVEWITTLIKDHGADINIRTLTNEAPLHCAIRQKCILPAKTLIQLGADVNARGFGMLTPLHYIMEIGIGMHALTTDELKVCIDGFKIVANTLVRYPSWEWSAPNDHTQSPVTSYYEADTDHMMILFMELFRHAADKLDFNAQSFLGYLPLHYCWQLARNIVDPGNLTQGVIDPKYFILAIPLTMIKYATREQLLTKNLTQPTPFDQLLTSNFTMLKPKTMMGVYPGVKEGFDIIFNRCLELIGDTIDINHVVTATTLDCEYYLIEMLANKAKENGKFKATDLKKSVHSAVASLLQTVLANDKLYALFKDVFGPLWSKPLERDSSSIANTMNPAIFNYLSGYSNACGYEEKVSRPKVLDELMKNGGIDWKVQDEETKENLLHAVLGWWRNSGCEALLLNQIWTRKATIETDKIIHDLIKLGVDPHHKNIFGQSFADIVPQYEKVVENHKYLSGEEKKAIQKENYFVDKKPSMLMELIRIITYSA